MFVVGVAQLVRAPGCGPGGRGFETPRPPQQNFALFGVCRVRLREIFCFSAFAFDLLEWRSVIAPLAQLVEQRTLNPQVLGSNPRGGTFCKFILA